MKKIFYAVLLLPILLISSCTNLDDINQKLDKHEERLKNFELLISQANEGINTLQQLLDAQAKKLTINTYEPLSDGSGYVLKMSDGSEIVLKNGVDGTSPKIGVTEKDGVLYWSLNGEIILDADGEPIPAEGQDGEDGVTPKIRVSRNGEWEISTDGGVNWEKILDSDGNPVKAKGEDAELDLSISETEEEVIIVYNGQTFIISKKIKVAVTEVKLNFNEYTLRVEQTVSLQATVMPEDAENQNITWSSNEENVASVNSDGLVTALAVGTAIITVTTEDGNLTDQCVITVKKKAPVHDKLAIEYITEYNVNADGTGFLTSQDTSKSGYFSHHKAMELFDVSKNFTVDGVGYHLPTLAEFRGIVPDYNSGMNVSFDYEKKVDNLSEEITIAGNTQTYTSDYVSLGNNNSYGIRFKGNGDKQRSAWRYQSVKNPDSEGEMMLMITVRYLGPENTDVTVDDISNDEWWEKDSEDNIVRCFPAAGFVRYTTDGYYTQIGTHGYFWTSTDFNAGNARSMDYTPMGAYTSYYWNSKSYEFSVRLFSNK